LALGYHYQQRIRCNQQRLQSRVIQFTQTHHTVGLMNESHVGSETAAIGYQKLQALLCARNIGILVVGHGTRNKVGSAQLLRLVEHIRELIPQADVSGCFLELAEPNIATGVQRLHDMGCKSMVVVPVLLFTAAHAKSDIPDAVREHATRLGVHVLGQMPSLGTHPRVVELSEIRFQEVVRLPLRSICPEGGCADGSSPRTRCRVFQEHPERCTLQNWLEGLPAVSASPFGKIALAMVGRGTSDVAALEHMRELTRLRVEAATNGTEEDGVQWFETGFFAGGRPTVDELLDGASRSGCDSVIVQPHLLFEGELMDQLREKVRTRRENGGGPAWWITRSLGADPKLAQVFVGLLMDQSAQW
jgi:sirohydrochlorin cobaltochelatase